MTSSNALKTAVIAGIGNGSGTGAATARLFAKQGFRVALIARNPDDLNKFAKSIQDDGGIAAAFPIAAYDHTSLSSAFKAIEQKWPSEVGKSGIKFALWNAGSATFGKFLEIDEAKLKEGIDTTVIGSFAFGQEVVRAILASTGEAEAQQGHRGTLIFTGATAALRGGAGFGAFAAGKFGVRAISQLSSTAASSPSKEKSVERATPSSLQRTTTNASDFRQSQLRNRIGTCTSRIPQPGLRNWICVPLTRSSKHINAMEALLLTCWFLKQRSWVTVSVFHVLPLFCSKSRALLFALFPSPSLHFTLTLQPSASESKMPSSGAWSHPFLFFLVGALAGVELGLSAYQIWRGHKYGYPSNEWRNRVGFLLFTSTWTFLGALFHWVINLYIGVFWSMLTLIFWAVAATLYHHVNPFSAGDCSGSAIDSPCRRYVGMDAIAWTELALTAILFLVMIVGWHFGRKGRTYRDRGYDGLYA